MIVRLLFLFALAFVSTGCSETSSIKHTKWLAIDGVDIIEFEDSTCLVTSTSKYTNHKDSIFAKYTIHNDTITLIPLQEYITFDAKFLSTDSGLVNFKKRIVVARKITDK